MMLSLHEACATRSYPIDIKLLELLNISYILMLLIPTMQPQSAMHEPLWAVAGSRSLCRLLVKDNFERVRQYVAFFYMGYMLHVLI